MAYGAIELTTISRSQDYATIKHNEDNKVGVDQNNFSNQVQKAVEQNVRDFLHKNRCMTAGGIRALGCWDVP